MTESRGTSDRPLVSIVTPTYQRVDLLRHTIDSIRTQSFSDLEHIVVDGGSTDGTIELLASQEEAYRLRWISEPDEGMYHAINKGLAMASGEILAYLNSDDLYFPWTVSTVVAAFERDPGADFVNGDTLVIDDATGETEAYWRLPFHLDFVRRIGFLSQPAVFWRRRAYEQLGPFDETLRYVADCDYWMRAGRRHRFRKVNEFLAVERSHAGTLREAQGDRVWPELERVRSRYVSLTGPRHDRMVRWHHRRFRFYRRLYGSTFLAQTLVPRSRVRGPWSSMLRTGRLSVSRVRLGIQLIPFLGPRLIDNFIRPSRAWLSPIDREDDTASLGRRTPTDR